MLVSVALTAETRRAVVTGDPVRVGERAGVGVAVAPAGGVGVGVPGDPERVGDTLRVRVGVAVPRTGVFVGLDVVDPWQIPALHGGVRQQSLSSTQELFWKSDPHVDPGHPESSLQKLFLFAPAAQTPAQNLRVATHVEPLHWLSRRHADPLNPLPPSKQTFAVPTHGRGPAQMYVRSQHASANVPEQVPIVASVASVEHTPEQVPLGQSHG
jgi:hypothetical protein